MKRRIWIIGSGVLLVVVLSAGFSSSVYALPGYLTLFEGAYPAAVGSVIDHCILCHTTNNPNTNSARNPFGADFGSSSIAGHTIHTFDTTLENRDSDGDGFTNIVEINALTFPGNAASHPTSSDTTPPTASLSIGSFLSSRKVSITLTATDNVGGTGVSGYIVSLSSTTPSKTSHAWKAVSPSTFTFPATALTGIYTLNAWAKDGAGNVSAVATATVNLDLSKPTVTTFTATSTNPASTTVNVSITATDPTVNGVSSGVVAYLVTRSNTPPSRLSPNWITAGTPPTSVIFPTIVKAGAGLFAWVKDASGNVSKPLRAVVAPAALAAPSPPVAAFQVQQETSPSPNASVDMTVWEGIWYKISMNDAGAYLKLGSWDPDNEVLQSELYQYDEQTGEWLSVNVSLHYLSGSGSEFLCWSQIADNDISYGFTARVNESGFNSIGGYSVQGVSRPVAGWLSIKGKVISEADVPVPRGILSK